MSLAVITEDFAPGRQTEPIGVPRPLDALDEPGTYICNWSGHLLRVRDPDATSFATVQHADRQPWLVTRISNDPAISRFKAKALAGSFGLSTSF